jgi:SAM-dependent methyltransferase
MDPENRPKETAMSNVPLYDDMGADYDRFVDWESRLAFELPALDRLLAQHGARRVLDAACGTGKHAIALAQRGYQLVGADLSAAMVARARENAAAAGAEVPFVRAGLGELAQAFTGPFDAVLCLGHSLPHLLSAEAVTAALRDFAQVLRPAGLLLLQNRNDERLLAQGQRFLPVSVHREGEEEWLFLRFLDLDPQRISFHMVTLHRDAAGWHQRVSTTAHRPIARAELVRGLQNVGFGDIAFYGSWNLEPFDAANSGDLVTIAERK